MNFSWIVNSALVVIPISFISIIAINMFKEYFIFRGKRLH